MSKEIYLKAKKLLEILPVKKKFIEYIDEVVLMNLERNNFLSMAFPHQKTEFVSKDAIYVRDSKQDKSAIVQIKEYKDSDLENSGFYAYCETDNSDSCIHVRYCLASDSLIRLYTLGKKA